MTALTSKRGAIYKRLLATYVALVLVTAIAAPGMAISAEGSSIGDTGSVEVSSTVQMEVDDDAQGPDIDPGVPSADDGSGVLPPESDVEAAVGQDPPVASDSDAQADGDETRPPVGLSSIGALGGVAPFATSAVVSGTSANLSFTFEGVRKSSGRDQEQGFG